MVTDRLWPQLEQLLPGKVSDSGVKVLLKGVAKEGCRIGCDELSKPLGRA